MEPAVDELLISPFFGWNTLQCYRELGDGIVATLRSPGDLGSEDQRGVELEDCSGKEGFLKSVFGKDFNGKGCE